MNVNQLTMPAREAREKLRAVRAQLHRRADAEYEQLATAYTAAAQGKPLISLRESLAIAPRDEKGRPKVAITRAICTQCRVTVGSSSRIRYDGIQRHQHFPWGSGRRGNRQVVSSDFAPSSNNTPVGYALVPIVPPDVRGNHSLETHHILWEVEQWADATIGAQPDRDPLLLKHLGGDLYAVVAEWDLTDLERAIMAGRAS